MTENERKTMKILADTIKGEINRMCVTNELAEFDTMYGHAKRNLDKLSKMIYDARFATEIEEQEDVDDWRDRLDELEREEYYESKYRE